MMSKWGLQSENYKAGIWQLRYGKGRFFTNAVQVHPTLLNAALKQEIKPVNKTTWHTDPFWRTVRLVFRSALRVLFSLQRIKDLIRESCCHWRSWGDLHGACWMAAMTGKFNMTYMLICYQAWPSLLCLWLANSHILILDTKESTISKLSQCTIM